MNESLKIAEHIARTTYADIPTAVLEAGKKSLLDTLGVILAAGSLGEGCQEFVELAISTEGHQESTIIGFGKKVHHVNKMLCEPNETKRHPVTSIDAKFSIPFAVATALYYGKVGLEHFFPSALKVQEVLDIAGKVICEVDDEQNLLLQPTQGLLKVTTLSGNSYEAKIEYPAGHPANPIESTALIQKFADCVKHARLQKGEQWPETVIKIVLNIENIKNVGELIKHL